MQPAIDAWASSQTRTDRAVDSLYATAEEVLHVYGDQRVAASTDGHDLDLDGFLAGDNTIYLYAPAHQQRLLRPLFETITQQVVAAAQEKAALSPDGMLSPRLGLFLDEAGNCAALSDLDVLTTTARGQGIQLVTVWHDKSQLEAQVRPQGVHHPEQPPGQAVPLRPGRPLSPGARGEADRRPRLGRAQPLDGLRRPPHP